MEAEAAVRPYQAFYDERPQLCDVFVGQSVMLVGNEPVVVAGPTRLYVEDRDCWRAFPRDRWVYDRLRLAERLGYPCGPAGTPFPCEGFYCVKPIINLAGMGSARKVGISGDVPPGYFFTPWFLGPHLSVNYQRRRRPDGWEPWLPMQALRCIPRPDGRPAVWIRTSDFPALPAVFGELVETQTLNVEYIGGFVIEAHLRHGFDFAACPDAVAAIVVWQGDPDADAPGLVSDVAGERIGFRYVT